MTLKQTLSNTVKAIADILYGASIYEMVRDLHKERSHLEHLFILIVFGDLLGIPVLPPYYTLRLLPFVVPNISGWKRNMLRERDLTDLCDQEIT
ncbi:MAG: hypothetical protein A2X25_05135 [Chloroflexi bacterium GWB2_49_20]|nr:MAG: hypothetical protein A2X25_05135 [Chloroflexi bacterium GWB2_49_20]OGN78574.1 MAG: hypothetical protein A2X26_12295 [Chloroflexi bacterium GWC2_49_37]OGN83272.1 MAG: hypothetical protein A2X27_13655 [Chloroflexi bacterium GWD2_49_16]HBG75130.1 hypothetical protein [Anaerolineae bacterium]HCC78950.1 hypothetical protein [Anaerolineae bacterium]